MKKYFSVIGLVILVCTVFLTGSTGVVKAQYETEIPDHIQKIVEESSLIPSKPFDEQFPLTENKKSLTIFAGIRPFVKDYDNNTFTKWYEEITNVDTIWDAVQENIIDEKRNIMLATGDYPDVLMNSFITQGQINLYGSQGVFIPLNDLIEEHSYYFKQILEARPWIKDIITSEDGNIYSLPMVNECYHCSYQQKMWIYKPWLDKLGLDIPTTTEEFYQVLKAFKEQDPNGNGKADEIPLSGANKGWRTNIDGFLMCPFIYNPSGDRLFREGDKILASYVQPGWKEGLKYINKLYEEGLLYPETFTQDNTQLKNLGENDEIAILGAAPAGYSGIFTQVGGERFKGYVAVPPLKGPDGYQTTFYNPYASNPGFFLITAAAEDPVLAFKWVDWFYSLEGTITSIMGRPDIEWRWAEKDEKGLNGGTALYKNIVNQREGIQNVNWNQANPSYRPPEFRLGRVWDGDPYKNERILYVETKEKYEGKELEGSHIPPLSFKEEELLEVEDLRVAINNYVEESIAQFVLGARDIEKEWDSYLNELKAIGLERYLEIHQDAYNRKYVE